MFWLLLLCAAGCCALLYRARRRGLYRVHAALPPGAVSHYPLVGHAHHFIGTDEDRMDFFISLAKNAVQQGGLCSIWMGRRLYVVICDPESAEIVMKACPHKDDTMYKAARMVTGNGSIFAPANVWRPRRKILAPTFSIKNLNGFMEVFARESAALAERLRPRAGAGDFSLWDYMATYTFDAICETTLGITLSSQTDSKQAALESLDVLIKLIAERMVSPWLYPDFIYNNLPHYKRLCEHRSFVYGLVDETIRNKRKEIEIRDKEGQENDENRMKCFLELMIESSMKESQSYSDLELREEVMVLVAAGTDSTAASTSVTLVMLSRHPDVQEKLHQELQEVFGDSDRPVTLEDLPKLAYMELVIKETLRLYPPTPIIAREVHDDVKLPCGTTLVDGVSVIVNMLGLHRNPRFWGEDAEQFRPERFLEGGLRHRAQYLPFSSSVRSCLGNKYAMMSMKTALASVLRRYRALPPAGAGAADLAAPLKMKFDVTMKHVDGYTIRLQERSQIAV